MYHQFLAFYKLYTYLLCCILDRKTYCTVRVLTVHSVLCEKCPASTTDINYRLIFDKLCVSLLVARLAMWRHEFLHRSDHVRIMVHKMAQRHVSPPPSTSVFPVSIIHPMPYAQLHTYIIYIYECMDVGTLVCRYI